MIAASNSPTSVPILERIGIYLHIHTNTDFSGQKVHVQTYQYLEGLVSIYLNKYLHIYKYIYKYMYKYIYMYVHAPTDGSGKELLAQAYRVA